MKHIPFVFIIALLCLASSCNIPNESTLDTQAPESPTELTVSNETATGFTMAWSAPMDNVGVTGYDVYQDGSYRVSVSTPYTIISGLTTGNTYTMSVRAKDAAGNISSASSNLSVVTYSAIGWPDASTTGVPTHIALSNASGIVRINVDNTVYAGIDLYGMINIAANNVIISNCRINSTNYFGINHYSGTNLIIEDCEIIAEGGHQYTGITGSNQTVRSCNIHGFENGLAVGSKTLTEDCYIHNMHYGYLAHIDGIEFHSNANDIVIRHNNIRLDYHQQTGCVNASPHKGGQAISNTIQSNLFYGGTYSLYIRGGTNTRIDYVTVEDNVWVSNSFAYGTLSMQYTSNITWTNNHMIDGTEISPWD